MHQILRKEILFCLLPTTLTPGPDQQQAIMHVLNLLTSGGFFRDNGLNSLPSIKQIARILNLKSGFKSELKTEKIVLMCQRRKFIEIFGFDLVLIDSGDNHLPIVYLENSTGGFHATILKETKISTINNNQFIIVKNSDTNESEIQVNLDMTQRTNGWRLAVDVGLYIEFS